jgi:hypothetical protein
MTLGIPKYRATLTGPNAPESLPVPLLEDPKREEDAP